MKWYLLQGLLLVFSVVCALCVDVVLVVYCRLIHVVWLLRLLLFMEIIVVRMTCGYMRNDFSG